MASAQPSSSTHADDTALPTLRTSQLHWAAYSGNAGRVKQRLAAGDHVDTLCSSDNDSDRPGVLTPLFLAAGEGHRKIVEVLLAAGANPSAVNPVDGTSVLYAAVTQNNLEVITLLLKAGAVVDWVDHKSRTVLLCAAYAGQDKVVKALLTACATVDQADSEGWTPLMTTGLRGHERCVQLLLEAGADLTKVGNDASQALHAAACGGSVAVARTLLDWGAEVNSIRNGLGGKMGMCPLHMAAPHGNVDVIKILLAAGADIEGLDEKGNTALRHAAFCGHDNAVQTLLSAGAKIDATCPTGSPSLYATASRGREDVVRTLLRWGADVDLADVLGFTSLFAASNEGHPKVVKLLLDAGADPQRRDQSDATALFWAEDLPTVKLLLEAGVSVNTVDMDGNSALHHIGTSEGSNTAMICAIFKAGANPGLLNKAGKTPAQVAREEGHNDAATLLDMLAAKYSQTENSALEAKDTLPTVAPSVGVAELEAKTSSCSLNNTKDEVVVDVVAECSEAIEEKKQTRVLRPCLSCQTLTHRRCARCRTASICSHDCQLATLAEHRVECLEIREENESAKAERKAAKKQERSG